jgi:hypothetical protein
MDEDQSADESRLLHDARCVKCRSTQPYYTMAELLEAGWRPVPESDRGPWPPEMTTHRAALPCTCELWPDCA